MYAEKEVRQDVAGQSPKRLDNFSAESEFAQGSSTSLYDLPNQFFEIQPELITGTGDPQANLKFKLENKN